MRVDLTRRSLHAPQYAALSRADVRLSYRCGGKLVKLAFVRKAALTLILAALCPASALDVRVLVATGPTLSVQLSGDSGSQALSSSALASWQIGVSGGHLTLGKANQPAQDTGSAVLSLPGGHAPFTLAGRQYRGGLILRATPGGVQGINVLDIEEYLRGVLPAEMPPLWPQAALRAQAIIARSYAASRINPAAPYDVCATTQCQVYGGVGREHPASDAAIAATRAQVVSSGGQVADTYFSADSGGYTASSLEVWGRDVPYLQARPDPFSPGAADAWTVQVPLTQVQSVAARYGVRVGQLSGVSETQASTSGRVAALSFVGTAGTQLLAGANAGGLLRSLGAKSSRITALSLSGQMLSLSGTGAGHGVGFSQWGAKNMAEQGHSDTALLNFYFPGAGVGLLSEKPADLSGLPAALPALAALSPTAFTCSLPATPLLATPLLATLRPAAL